MCPGETDLKPWTTQIRLIGIGRNFDVDSTARSKFDSLLYVFGVRLGPTKKFIYKVKAMSDRRPPYYQFRRYSRYSEEKLKTLGYQKLEELPSPDYYTKNSFYAIKDNICQVAKNRYWSNDFHDTAIDNLLNEANGFITDSAKPFQNFTRPNKPMDDVTTRSNKPMDSVTTGTNKPVDSVTTRTNNPMDSVTNNAQIIESLDQIDLSTKLKPANDDRKFNHLYFNNIQDKASGQEDVIYLEPVDQNTNPKTREYIRVAKFDSNNIPTGTYYWYNTSAAFTQHIVNNNNTDATTGLPIPTVFKERITLYAQFNKKYKSDDEFRRSVDNPNPRNLLGELKKDPNNRLLLRGLLELDSSILHTKPDGVTKAAKLAQNGWLIRGSSDVSVSTEIENFIIEVAGLGGITLKYKCTQVYGLGFFLGEFKRGIDLPKDGKACLYDLVMSLGLRWVNFVDTQTEPVDWIQSTVTTVSTVLFGTDEIRKQTRKQRGQFMRTGQACWQKCTDEKKEVTIDALVSLDYWPENNFRLTDMSPVKYFLRQYLDADAQGVVTNSVGFVLLAGIFMPYLAQRLARLVDRRAVVDLFSLGNLDDPNVKALRVKVRDNAKTQNHFMKSMHGKYIMNLSAVHNGTVQFFRYSLKEYDNANCKNLGGCLMDATGFLIPIPVTLLALPADWIEVYYCKDTKHIYRSLDDYTRLRGFDLPVSGKWIGSKLTETEKRNWISSTCNRDWVNLAEISMRYINDHGEVVKPAWFDVEDKVIQWNVDFGGRLTKPLTLKDATDMVRPGPKVSMYASTIS